MTIKSKKDLRRSKIRMKIRKIVKGTTQRPRLCVFRSNKEIYAQIIDDDASKTLVAASSQTKEVATSKITKTEKAKQVGALIAEKAIEAGITEVVFDRSGYLYHGRVKTLADAAREKGLKF